jgi:hypothetical protein
VNVTVPSVAPTPPLVTLALSVTVCEFGLNGTDALDAAVVVGFDEAGPTVSVWVESVLDWQTALPL